MLSQIKPQRAAQENNQRHQENLMEYVAVSRKIPELSLMGGKVGIIKPLTT